MRALLATALVLAGALVGCRNEDAGLEPAFVPKTHVFEGAVDERYVGVWTSTDGVSTLDLAKDGSLKIETLTPTPSGSSKSEVGGKWLASDGNLLFQYGDEKKGMTVLKYNAKLEKDALKLKQDGGRSETAYKRG
ncbi:MAG TPA: hypothetical protein VGE01_01515 [Fimbriimonas sp.]